MIRYKITKIPGYKRIKSVQMQLTTQCNQKCVFCRKYTWENKVMPLDVLEKKIKKYKHCTFQFSGGEPLLYDYLFKLNQLIRRYSIKYKVYTNLSFNITDAECLQFLLNAEQISVSLDGMSKEIYNQVRRPINNKAFRYLMINIHNLINIKNKGSLKLCMVVNKLNISDVPEMVKFCNDWKVQGRFYPLHTNMEMALNMEDLRWLERELYNTGWLGLSREIGDKYTNVESLFEPGYFSIERYFIPCRVRNRHRVIDEKGYEYTCCYAINDNGIDICGKNRISDEMLSKIDNNGEKFREDNEFDFCRICSRYRKANECSIEEFEEMRYL